MSQRSFLTRNKELFVTWLREILEAVAALFSKIGGIFTRNQTRASMQAPRRLSDILSDRTYRRDPPTDVAIVERLLAFLNFADRVFTGSEYVDAEASKYREVDELLERNLDEMRDFSSLLQKGERRHETVTEIETLKDLVRECADIFEGLSGLYTHGLSTLFFSRSEKVENARKQMRKMEELANRAEKCRTDLKPILHQLQQTAAQQKPEVKIKPQGAENQTRREYIKSMLDATNISCLGSDALLRCSGVLKSMNDVIFEHRVVLVLDALRFETMDDRFHSIEVDSSKMFDWMFPDPTQPQTLGTIAHSNDNSCRLLGETFQEARENDVKWLRTWLSSEDGIFFIAGRRGCGKSTFTKFLFQHEKTQEMLLSWAGAKKLVKARFFFHRQGTSLQKSVYGLCRTLLSSILSQCPELISDVFPKAWEETERSGLGASKVSFREIDIVSALESLLSKAEIYKKRKFALFIDGLNECELSGLQECDLDDEAGGDKSIMSIFKTWCSRANGNLKICLSSGFRRYIFDALEQAPTMELHFLTRQDLFNYAGAIVDKHPLFAEARSTAGRRQIFLNTLDTYSEGIIANAIVAMTQCIQWLEKGMSTDRVYRKWQSEVRSIKQRWRLLDWFLERPPR